jgi:hypothetical protein
MTSVFSRFGFTLLAVILAAAVQADTLELRSGDSLSGSYAGGSSNNVRFRTDGGTQTYNVTEVDSLFFEERDGDAGDPRTSSTDAGAGGDTLELRSGDSKKGNFAGGSSSNVRFSAGGTLYTYNVAAVDAIFFGGQAGSAPAAAAAPAAAPAPAPAPRVQMTAPAGTRVMVRNVQAIDSRRQQAGYRFTVRLESDLVADNGEVIAPRGANAYGVLTQAQQSGRVAGRSELTLTLTDIMVNNQMRPVVTSSVQAVSDSTGGQTARRTLGAAAIGALIDGRSGAATGAAVGAGASILTQGQSINIPAGTLLEFRLGQPFSG